MADEDKFYDDEDMVGSAPTQRNWKGIIIAMLVIVFVMGMILTSVFLLTPPDEGPRVRGKRLNLSDILGPDFEVREFNGTWITDNEFVYRDASGGLSAFDAVSLVSKPLIPNITFQSLAANDFSLSADLRYVLLYEKQNRSFTHPSASRHHVVNIESQQATELTPTPEVRGHPPLHLVQWSTVRNALAIVDSNYDILYKPSVEGNVHRITKTGVPGVVYNGYPDWLYEQEILKEKSALWFSPNGQFLAYGTFNDSQVDDVPIMYYGYGEQYASVRNIKYPKTGRKNPVVTLWVADLRDLRSLKAVDIKPPDLLKDKDHYFNSVSWIDNESLCVVWMNRAQNVSVITICREPIYFCETTHTERANHGWVDMYDAPLFSNNGQNYLVVLPVRDGYAGEFNHINLYNVRMKRVTPITHGKFEVTRILGWDQNENYIYYMATNEDQPGERHLYRVADVSSPLLRMPDCLSCVDLENTTTDAACLYSRAHISPNYTYLVLDCLGPEVPRTYLISLWSNQVIHILDNHDALRTRISETALPQVKTFRVELEGEGSYTAHVQLLLPPGLREDEITTFPMVVAAYAAPGSQSVTSRLEFHWGSYLASKKDIIYARIDGRGSGFKGNKIKHEVFQNLGQKEVDDQLAVTTYLRDNLHFIDPERIAIWGWNYGGYITTMVLTRDVDQVFKCGVAVAPISRFEHYDSVFTERFMGFPHIHPGSNYKGYEAADATKVAGNMKEKMFLVIHGTGDDRVHYHHSMMLAQALTDAGVLFRQITYSDERHGLAGVREHLYKSMESFIADCYRPSLQELYTIIKKKKKELDEIAYL